MQFWCNAQTISLCFVVAACLPTLTKAQQPETTVSTTAYQQVRDSPFQRMSLTELPQTIPTAPEVTSIPHSASTGAVRLISKAATSESAKTTTYLPTTVSPLPEPSEQSNETSRVISSHVVIQPPMVQPYKSNQYSFVVENLGEVDAEEVTIEISVDETARIIAMLPSDSVVTDRNALLKIKKLHAGEHSTIHLTATSSLESPIRFRAKLVHTSIQDFDPQVGAPGIAVGPIARHQTTEARPFVLEALPASTPSHHVPIVSVPPEFQPRPHFQSNPHFRGDQTGTQLAQQPLRPRTPFQSVSSGGLTTSVGPIAKRQPEAILTEDQFSPDHFTTPIQQVPNRERSQVVENSSQETSLPSIESIAPFSGPRNMDQTTTREFSLAIINPTNRTVHDVFVQLTVPQGLEIMTFDRQTWYDDETRTISFKIPGIEAAEFEVVNYELKAAESGFQIQKLVVEAKGLERTEVRLDTLVH